MPEAALPSPTAIRPTEEPAVPSTDPTTTPTDPTAAPAAPESSAADGPPADDPNETLNVPRFLAVARAATAQTEVVNSVPVDHLVDDFDARRRLATQLRRYTREVHQTIPDSLFTEFRQLSPTLPSGRTPSPVELRAAYVGLASFCDSVYQRYQRAVATPAAHERPASSDRAGGAYL